LVYEAKGDHDRAIADYNEAIRVKPDYADAFNNRGVTYDHKGDHDRAIADYTEAIRIKPDYAAAFNNRGLAYYSKGDYDSAIADYAAAIRLAPNYTAAFNNRGLAYVLKENYEAAIADCTEAIRLDPKAANPHRHRAAAFVGKGDFDRALTDVEEAIRLNPKYASAYATRGVVFEKKGDLTRALADFNQALALQSDLADAIAGRDRIRATVVATAPTTTPTTLSASPARETAPTSLPVASPPARAPFLPLGRRVALIVANHAYPVAPLANPPVDAELIKASLEKIGFSVVVKSDVDLDAFEQALTDFAEASKGADVALFYFAGHGFSISAGGRQQNLLMSTSANFAARTAFALQGGGEPLEHIEETIIGHARATLIFIDACRNVPLVASRGVGSRGFAPIDSSNFEGAYVVLSTRQGKTAEDGLDGQGSPFARAFASVLPAPGLRIEDAYARIREKVRVETSGQQVPDVIRSDLPEGGVVLAAPAER
jgi:lipoprotein NlpI